MAAFRWPRPQVVLSRKSFNVADQISGAFCPVVHKTGEGYRVWMNVYFVDSHCEIWHAASDDGIHFGVPEKAFGPDTISNDLGPVNWVGCISPLQEDGGYRMWFQVGQGNHRRVYTATSPDGLRIHNPQLAVDTGSCPPYDNLYSYNPTVLRDRTDGRYRMWRTGWEKWDVSDESARGLTPAWQRIIHCWSQDGLTWQDHRLVIDMGAEGEHDVLASRLPGNVIQLSDGSFEIWYAGSYRDEQRDTAVCCVMRALSDDGLNWHSFSMEIPPGFQGRWDAWYSYSPFAIREADKIRLWYGGRSHECGWCILHTEAPT